MKSRSIFVGLLFTLLMITPAFAQTTRQPAGPVELSDGQDQYAIGHHMEILRDPSGELTIQDVTGAAYQDQFIPSQVDTPNFGYQDAVYWVHFQVLNQSGQTSNWVLEQGFANMHYMDLYLLSPQGTDYQVLEGGVLRPFEKRDFPFHLLAFKLDIPPGSEQTIYIRFQNQASMTLPLTLWSQNAFTQVMLAEQLILGIVFGALVIMLLYNLFLWSVIRERAYLYLALFLLSFIAFNAFYDGSVYQFIPIRSPRLATTALVAFLGLWLYFVVKFVVELLDLKILFPKFFRGSQLIAGAYLLTVLAAPFIAYKIVVSLQLIVGITLFLIIIGFSLKMWQAGSRPARYLLASWILFLIGGILGAFTRFGILPSSVFTEKSIYFGVVWMAVVWSLALADRVNTLKAETEHVNRQLSESESRMTQFLEAMPVGVVVHGSDFIPRYINQAAVKLLSNPDQGIFPDLKLQRTLAETRAYYAFKFRGTGEAYPLERLPAWQALDGHPASADDLEISVGDRRVPIESWANPLYASDGKVDSVIVAFQDISERLSRDAQLKESQQVQRLALDGAQLGIWSHELATGDILWDARTRGIFGLSPDEPISHELASRLIHPEDRTGAQAAFDQAIAPDSDGVYAEDQRIVRPDGQIRWISTRGKAVFENQGSESRAVRLVGIVMDVTERVLAEQALEESETRYRRLVETMNEGIGVSDADNRLTYVNPRLCEMLGYSAAEMLNRSVIDFFDEENRQIIVDQLARRRLGEEQAYTLTWRRKDGGVLHTQIAPAAVFNDRGEFTHSIAVITDISEQIEAKQMLEQRVTERTRELRTLLEVSQIVVGNLEIKTLLKVILEQLHLVVDFTGAAIVSLHDRQLTTLNFDLPHDSELSVPMSQKIFMALQDSTRIMRDEAIIIPDILADTPDGHNFRAIVANLFDVDTSGIRSWMGVPLMIKQNLVGVLSIHHSQPNIYTPEMGELAHIFTNQAAVAIENAGLYQQARDTAATEERNRLARELHDSVTQALYSLMLHAEAARLALNHDKAEVAEKNLREVQKIAREGLADLRLLIFELRPPVLDEEGLVGALQARLEAVEVRAGCRTEFHVEGQPDLSQEVESELYWVVHEALNNILKHSHAKVVNLDLVFNNGESQITIRDDGVGFDHNKFDLIAGMGFKNIVERIDHIGGNLKIESEPGQGTLFQVKIGSH